MSKHVGGRVRRVRPRLSIKPCKRRYTYLAVREDGAVVPVQHRLDHIRRAHVVDMPLRGGGPEDGVEGEDSAAARVVVLALREARGGCSGAIRPPDDNLPQRLVRLRDAVLMLETWAENWARGVSSKHTNKYNTRHLHPAAVRLLLLAQRADAHHHLDALLRAWRGRPRRRRGHASRRHHAAAVWVGFWNVWVGRI